MKILISGATGLLGGALVKCIGQRNLEYVAVDRRGINLKLGKSAVDALDQLFDGVDYFIHAAANTNVDYCEINQDDCYRDNVLLTELLASASRRNRVPMIFISSVGVYGADKQEPWNEYDITKPCTVHHRSKLLGEECVLAADRSNLVIRTGWLFGGNALASKNFVAKRILEAHSAKEGFIFANAVQRGCPTFIDDAAERILDLISLNAQGVFNVVNDGNASRFEYVDEIIKVAALKTEVRPVAAEKFNRIAAVSINEMAINWKADNLGMPKMRFWKNALAHYLLSEDANNILI